MIASVIARPGISRAAGCFMDSRLSALFIKPFIRKNGIDTSEALPQKYKSFNDFFTRRLLPGARPFVMDKNTLPSPCDGLLSVYPVTKANTYPVKGTNYTLSALLDDEKIASSFQGGTMLIFRLTPSHYHRYAFPDSGFIENRKKIRGVFHTVRPAALENVPVFKTNTREYMLLNTENFGRMIYMEVGATMVGRIQNDVTQGAFSRGQEKGRFEFGGSTIILILEKGAWHILPEIRKNTQTEAEAPVKMGQAVLTTQENHHEHA